MVALNLRLPDKTHEKITKISEKEKRSINQQITFIVEQYIRDYEKITGKAAE